MEQAWFEMTAERRRKLNSAVWIPLRAGQKYELAGRAGFLGYKENYVGFGTLAVPLEARDAAAKLGWTEIGNSWHHRPHVEDQFYQSADEYTFADNERKGIHLVLDQRLN